MLCPESPLANGPTKASRQKRGGTTLLGELGRLEWEHAMPSLKVQVITWLDTVQSCENGSYVVMGRDGREHVYGQPNAGVPGKPAGPQGPVYRRSD
jgi:hypothetical protein